MKLKLIIFLIFIYVFSFSQKRPKIGLVLSGGGAKGIAHIGVIRYLESKGIKPDYIVGTSFGALVGGFYAMGYTPDEMETIIKFRDWDYLLNDEILRKNVLIGQGDKNKNTLMTLPLEGLKPKMASGLYKGQNILTFFELMSREYNRQIDFDSLIIPFRCVATNIETGEGKVFDKGIVPDALRASLSIPSIFSPYNINGELYVDGGIVNNFPTDVVKDMGADIIIGVDVGAVLYKKEEINSILRILDQTSSFYNSRIAQENKKLCDIYIRPNIEGISAMDFSETDTIINRGYIAAKNSEDKLDSVFGKFNLEPIKDKHRPFSTNRVINIDTIKITTDLNSFNHERGSKRLIMGKLKIKTPLTITEKGLTDRINRLYGSKYFEKISMRFEPTSDTSYALLLNVSEKKENDFSIGARFDQQYGVNVLLAAQFRNLLLYGSLLELRAVAGQSPQFRARYTTDRGSSLGFGSSMEYNNFTVYTYQESEKSAEYNYNRIMADLFMHSYLGNYNRVVLGAEYSSFLLSSNQTISDIKNINNNYFNLYGSYVVDTWDRAYYPNKGFQFKIRSDMIFHENDKIMNVAWAKANIVMPISKKIKVIAEGFVGYGTQNIDTTLFRYEVGGMANNHIEWYNSMPGLEYLEHGANNIWIAKLSPRYEFIKNNYLTATLAITAMDNIFENLFLQADRMYTGVGIKYGFNSMFGPLEISADYAFNSYNTNYFINLGFWF